MVRICQASSKASLEQKIWLNLFSSQEFWLNSIWIDSGSLNMGEKSQLKKYVENQELNV